MKHLLPLIVLLGTTASASAAPRPVDGGWPGLVADQPHPAVVRIAVSEDGTMSLGSGSLVAVHGRHGLIVTNWHVVRDARGPIHVVFPDGFRSGATVLATDADWDLAALAIWRPNVEPIRVSRRTPQQGETLSIAGYGSGRYRSSSGRCVQYISPGANHPFEMLEVSTSAREGDSGGPIFNEQGELAGVLFGAARGRTAGSYCGRVQWFLNSASARFLDLSSPSDTLIARDLPAPPVTTLTSAPAADEIAVAPIPRPVENSWQPSTESHEEPQPQHRALPLASIPAPTGGRADAQDRQVDEPALPSGMATGDTLTPTESGTSGQPATSETDPAQPAEVPVRWSDLAGETRAEQIKNALAAIGIVAVVFHGLKIFSALQGEPPKSRRRSTRR